MVGDVTPPATQTLSPADDATGFGVNANLVMTFNEEIQKGTGNIVVKRAGDNSVVATIDVSSAQVTVSGSTATIDPSTTLDVDTTTYYVEVTNGAFEDLSGNDFAGISGPTAWNFTTVNYSPLTSIPALQ